MWLCASHDASGFHGHRALQRREPPRRAAKFRSAPSSRSATPSSRKPATAPANSTIRPRMPKCWRSATASAALSAERLGSADLYVTLEPCAMCAAAISFARIRRLYFGAADEKGGAVVSGVRFFASPTCHHVPEIYPGIGRDTVRRTAARFLPGAATADGSDQNGLRSLRLNRRSSCALRASGGVPCWYSSSPSSPTGASAAACRYSSGGSLKNLRFVASPCWVSFRRCFEFGLLGTADSNRPTPLSSACANCRSPFPLSWSAMAISATIGES